VGSPGEREAAVLADAHVWDLELVAYRDRPTGGQRGAMGPEAILLDRKLLYLIVCGDKKAADWTQVAAALSPASWPRAHSRGGQTDEDGDCGQTRGGAAEHGPVWRAPPTLDAMTAHGPSPIRSDHA
jgi:hypothetical protein